MSDVHSLNACMWFRLSLTATENRTCLLHSETAAMMFTITQVPELHRNSSRWLFPYRSTLPIDEVCISERFTIEGEIASVPTQIAGIRWELAEAGSGQATGAGLCARLALLSIGTHV